MMRRRRSFAIATLAALSVAACQLIAGIEDQEGTPRSATGEAGPVPPDASDADVVKTCVPHVPPSPPPVEDPTGNQGAPLFFAIRQAFSAVDGGTVGYDIDDHCSAGGADVPCHGSPNDRDGGIDNAFFADFISSLAIPIGGSDPALATTNEAIDAGSDGIFLAVYGYNGQPDDDKVSFALVSSPGLVSTACGDAGAEAGPRWDGCDVWSIGSTKIIATVLQEVQPAYVTQGTLVVRYGTKDLAIRFGGTELRLRDAIVSAKLVPLGDGRHELQDGVITGRAPTADLFESAARVTVRVGGSVKHLCETPATIEVIRDNICPARDLRLAGDDPSSACDGLSIAIGFGASPAAVGLPGGDKVLFTCAPFDASCP